MENVKVDEDYYFCLNFEFLQKCLFRSPVRFVLLSFKSLYLIGCQGDKKINLRKM